MDNLRRGGAEKLQNNRTYLLLPQADVIHQSNEACSMLSVQVARHGPQGRTMRSVLRHSSKAIERQ